LRESSPSRIETTCHHVPAAPRLRFRRNPWTPRSRELLLLARKPSVTWTDNPHPETGARKPPHRPL